MANIIENLLADNSITKEQAYSVVKGWVKDYDDLLDTVKSADSIQHLYTLLCKMDADVYNRNLEFSRVGDVNYKGITTTIYSDFTISTDIDGYITGALYTEVEHNTGEYPDYPYECLNVETLREVISKEGLE